jgi:hypothetical protein
MEDFGAQKNPSFKEGDDAEFINAMKLFVQESNGVGTFRQILHEGASGEG